MEKHVSSLHKHKDDVQKDFERVEGQAKYRLMFIATRDAKLSRLRLELDAQILNVSNFRSQDNENQLIATTLVQQESLQRKIDL